MVKALLRGSVIVLCSLMLFCACRTRESGRHACTIELLDVKEEADETHITCDFSWSKQDGEMKKEEFCVAILLRPKLVGTLDEDLLAAGGDSLSASFSRGMKRIIWTTTLTEGGSSPCKGVVAEIFPNRDLRTETRQVLSIPIREKEQYAPYGQPLPPILRKGHLSLAVFRKVKAKKSDTGKEEYTRLSNVVTQPISF